MNCTLCGLPAEPTFEFCQACGHRLAARSKHSRRAPTEIVVPREPAVALVDATTPTCGTRWLSFWTYFVLPVHAFFALLLGLPLLVFAAGFVQALGFHYVALGAVCVGISIGLERRRAWAWTLNQFLIYLLIAETVVLTASLQVAAIGASGQPFDASAFAVIGLLLLALAAGGGLLWIWPNHVYWHKRKGLFESSPGPIDAEDRRGALGLWFLGRRLPATCTGVVLVVSGVALATVSVRSLPEVEQVEVLPASASSVAGQADRSSSNLALGTADGQPR